MGIMDWMKAAQERASDSAVYGGHRITGGAYLFVQPRGIGVTKKSLTGAVAEYESGASSNHTTIGRVAVGAIVAGPVGAVVGGMFKKNRTRGYVTTVFSDGSVVIVDGPIKDEGKMREFAAKVNASAARHSAESE